MTGSIGSIIVFDSVATDQRISDGQLLQVPPVETLDIFKFGGKQEYEGVRGMPVRADVTIRTDWSFGTTFVPKGYGGYIYAKGNRDGRRYFSLYLSKTANLIMYYTTAARLRKAVFPCNITLGRTYTAVLTVAGASASL